MIKPKPFIFLLILFFIQSSAFPSIATGAFKPDLVLLGVLLLALELAPQNILGEAVIIGILLDVISGRFFGIHAIVALLIPLLIFLFSKIFSTSKVMLLFFFATIFTLIFQITLYFLTVFSGLAITQFSTFMVTQVFPSLFWNIISILLLYGIFNPLLVGWSHEYET
jgi:rod shape-determining protein MreD